MEEEIKFKHNGSTYIVAELKVPNSELTYDMGCILKPGESGLELVTYFYGITQMSKDKIIEIAKIMIR